MDAIKDISTAFLQRIKSPIFGSIILAFVVINWKPIFYVIFSNKNVEGRFIYWDKYWAADTYCMHAIFGPLIVGIVYSLLSPWVSFYFAKWIKSAVGKHREMQVQEANKIRKIENESAEVLITAAEQKERVDKLQNDKERKDLQKQINEMKAQPKLLLSGDAAEKGNVDPLSLIDSNETNYLLLEAIDFVAKNDKFIALTDLNKIAGNFSPEDIKITLRGWIDQNWIDAEWDSMRFSAKRVRLTKVGKSGKAGLRNKISDIQYRKIIERINQCMPIELKNKFGGIK